MASRLAWFLTPAGRKFVAISATVSACGAALAAYLPHTGLLEKHRDFVGMRKNNQVLQVSDKLQSLFSEVLEELSLNDYYKTISKPFMVFGFEVYHMGSLTSRKGTYIGLPINFTYESPASIKKNDIFIKDEPVNWNREDAKQLLDSLLLSDDAKKYAIGREVLMTDNNHILWNSINSGVLTGGCYGLTSQLNTSMNLYARPRILRVMLYSLTSLFFWGLWATQKDALVRYYESDVDEHLAQLGERYIRGAIEYYDKSLQRNKALRTLFGTQGAGAYNTDGDEVFLFRQKHLPISHRKEFFEKKLKEREQGTTQAVVAAPAAAAAADDVVVIGETVGNAVN